MEMKGNISPRMRIVRNKVFPGGCNMFFASLTSKSPILFSFIHLANCKRIQGIVPCDVGRGLLILFFKNLAAYKNSF